MTITQKVSQVSASRRGFLKITGAGLTVAFLAGCALPVIPKRPAATLKDGMGWVRFADGRYTLYIPRVEMGQNILTALKQIACDELGVSWNQVDARLHTTRDIPRARATVGSDSIKDFAMPLAQACAILRDAIATGQNQGELKAKERPVSELRVFGQLPKRYIGKSPEIEQGLAIVKGKPLYAADTVRPNMVYGRVLRAPVSPEVESTLLSMNESAVKGMPGFVALVRDKLLGMGLGEGVGIVATTPGTLDRIEQALDLRWRTGSAFDQSSIDALIDIDRLPAEKPGRANKVHYETLREDGRWDIDLRFDIPLAAHAPIEPRSAVAEFNGSGELHLWVGSQDVFYQRDVIVKRLDLSEDKVVVHGQRVGGAFGGKTICTVELEAAVLARAVGLPVKVQWARAQEFRLGFHRPPSSHRIRASLQDGKLQNWWHSFVSSHILFTNAVVPVWMQRLTDIIGDDGVGRGSALPYRAQARRTEFDLVRIPVYTGPWRGLGAGPNAFVIESVMDECARHVNADPVAFRLLHIEDPRLARVLQSVAESAAWEQPSSQTKSDVRRGRGVACGIYKSMSYAAVVADVEVSISTGKVKVSRMWCAHDCGAVVNPDQVRAQCEGNLVWGMGMVLTERLTVADSQVGLTTFGESPIPRFVDIPSMEVVLVNGDEPPTGAGETAIVASGAAVANAIRDAVGVRLQQLPWSPELLRNRPLA